MRTGGWAAVVGTATASWPSRLAIGHRHPNNWPSSALLGVLLLQQLDAPSIRHANFVGPSYELSSPLFALVCPSLWNLILLITYKSKEIK